MAKISLRNYDREIEGLIDQGHLDEAIAHCRHILQTFSKHLGTYRLLGKAYLEAKRYDEAVDVFTRVLTAVPDDFVSHVGMSIIRDEQNRLDEAISHMERAFEAQPSNAAIQGELQRLFGRRDGIEPPKIRMNRGALAHMYLQGELYPQAISEIKAVLAADSQREDMKALLARAYFHAGQKADASDVCSQLLDNYAYSFDANRIMTELMQGSESSENSELYRNRVLELDPYAAYSASSVFRSNEVADVAVSLEHLDYQGQEVEPAPEWKPAGIGVPPPDEQPEWLKKDYSYAVDEPPAPQPESQSDIPEFMSAAGWTESTGTAEESGPFDLGSEPTGEADLVPGEMPDWLKAMAPVESEEAPTTPIQPVAPLASADMPDWLNELTPKDVESEESPSTPIPPVAPLASADMPDWLNELAPKDLEPEESPGTPILPGVPLASTDMPDWLNELAPKDVEQESAPPAPAAEVPYPDTPDWLRDLGSESDALASKSEIPDWLQNVEAAEPDLAPSSTEASLPDWLQPAVDEQAAGALPSEPEPFSQELPPIVTPVEPLESPQSLDSLGTSAQEQDDAMAWLESLAAKHGAKAEELITDPNTRSEKPPEWVEKARELGETQPIITGAASEPVFLEPEAEHPIEPVQPLEPVQPFTEPLEPIVPGLERSVVFEETEDARIIEPESELPPEPVEPEPEPPLAVVEPLIPAAFEPAADETGIWLRSLDEKEAAPTEESAEVFASDEFIESIGPVEPWSKAPEPIAPAEEETLLPLESEPEGVTPEASDLPDWLQDIDQEEKWSTPASSMTDELPSWLRGEAEPSSEAEPTLPSDWHPVESTSDLDLTPAEMQAAPEPSQDYLAEMQSLREQPLSSEPELEPEAEPEMLHEPETDAELEKESELEPELQQEAELEAPRGEELEPEVPAPLVTGGPPEPPPAPRKTPTRPVLDRRSAVTASQVGEPALAMGRSEMNRGNIPAALDQYGRLIKRGKYLEEIIHDMREALYRYPVEITIWQTLGDAYMRENRLQEALDAYTKAEELLR